MALYDPITVKLKNKNAGTDEYDDIRQIRVPNAAGGYALFTNVEQLRCYIVKPTGADGYYEVVTVSIFNGGATNGGGVLTGISSTVFAEDQEKYYYTDANGVKTTAVLFSTRALTPGETFHYTWV